MVVAAPNWPAKLSLLPCQTVAPLITKLGVGMGVAGWPLLCLACRPIGWQMTAYGLFAAGLCLALALNGDEDLLGVLGEAGPPALKPVLLHTHTVAGGACGQPEMQSGQAILAC
jgi:hypothetical protein